MRHHLFLFSLAIERGCRASAHSASTPTLHAALRNLAHRKPLNKPWTLWPARIVFAASMLSLAANHVVAQTPDASTSLRTVSRNYGGWQSSETGTNARTGTDPRNAYFQTSGLPMQPTALPALPQDGYQPASLPSGLPPLNSNDGRMMPGGMPVSPLQQAGMQPSGVQQAGGLPTYEPFRNPGGVLPPTEVTQASDTQLRNAQVARPGNMPAPSYGNNQGAAGYQPAMFQQGLPTADMPAGVYPPGGYPQSGYAQGGYAQGGYSQPVMPPPSPSQGYAQQPQSATQLRDASVATAARQQTVNGIPVVSQDPRFISPPPRTGNYATLPYTSPFRTVAYQVPQAVVPQVQTPTGLATQPANVANTSTLPQYQPTVGVTPIAYQPGYQAGYQAGYQYCAPGIPAGGVPQVVPGAVAPPTYPPNMAPQLYSPDNSGFKPLFSLGQENYNVQLGRGIIGQPTAYVPGQPVRNFLRYLSP